VQRRTDAPAPSHLSRRPKLAGLQLEAPDRSIDRCRFLGRSQNRPAGAAAAHPQTPAQLQNTRRPPIRQAHFLLHVHRQCQHLRSHLHLCRPQRIGGLQRVPGLNASPPAGAVTNLGIKTPHDSFANSILLTLRLRLIIDCRSTAFALLRQRNANLFVDVIGRLPCFPYSPPLMRPGLRFLLPFPSRIVPLAAFSRRYASSSSSRSRSFSATSFSFCFRRESISSVSSSTVGGCPKSSGFIHGYGNPAHGFVQPSLKLRQSPWGLVTR
jgi:hypothetical protein